MSTATRIVSKTEALTSRATISVEEAGARLGIGRGLAYEAARRGEIPALRLGRRLVVPVAALERLLANGGPPVASDDDLSAA